MRPETLLRLYPANWRARYQDEFIEVVGRRNLSAQQTIDILAGAVDAWISPSVRASVRATATKSGSGGRTVIQQLRAKCATSTPRYTTRDALISAGVLIASSSVLLAAGILASRSGYHDTGEVLKGLGFPAAMLLSMPFAITKGQSLRAQAVFLGVPMAILIVISYVATKL